MIRKFTAVLATVAVCMFSLAAFAANPDRPVGFAPYGPCYTIEQTCGATATFAKGDVVKLASGKMEIAVGGTDRDVYGVAAEACAAGTPASGSYVSIWSATDCIFQAQASGTAAITHVGTVVDYEGTTGIGEVDENGTTLDVFFVLGLVGTPDNAWGANAQIFGRFVRPQGVWGDIAITDIATSIVRSDYGLSHSQTTGLQIDYDGTYVGIDGSSKLSQKRFLMTGHQAVGGANTFTYYLPAALRAGTVNYFGVSLSTGTSSSAGNLWAITVTDSAGNAMSSAPYDTFADGDLTAHVLLDMSSKLDQNQTVLVGELLRVTFTETGAATDLSAIYVGAVIGIDAF